MLTFHQNKILRRLLTYDYPDYHKTDDAHNYHHLKIDNF